jgi:hypothetical protein
MPAINVTAGGLTNFTRPLVDNLLSGSAEIITEGGYTVGATAIAALRTVGVVTATGLLVPHNPAAADGSQNLIGAMVYAGAANSTGNSVYVAGQFNHDALTWDATLTTLALRRAQCRRTAFFVGSISAT